MIEGIKILKFIVADTILILLVENSITKERAAFMSGTKGFEVDEIIMDNTMRYGWLLNVVQARAFFPEEFDDTNYVEDTETLYRG